MRDAVKMSIDHAKGTGVKKVLVAVADGKDNASTASMEHLAV